MLSRLIFSRLNSWLSLSPDSYRPSRMKTNTCFLRDTRIFTKCCLWIITMRLNAPYTRAHNHSDWQESESNSTPPQPFCAKHMTNFLLHWLLNNRVGCPEVNFHLNEVTTCSTLDLRVRIYGTFQRFHICPLRIHPEQCAIPYDK